MLDYHVLRLIWWALLGVLLIGVAVMDGLDYGAMILMPFAGRTDAERRVIINTVGPVWEGNQVWLILGGGAVFAAWPPLYAVAFSGFYLAMLLLLLSLIMRATAFTFRSKVEDGRWRAFWDWALFAGGLIPALVTGVAFGNVLQGVPFRFDDTLRLSYEGDLIGLFNPFALLCGLVSVAMITLHGAAYLAAKTEGAVADRARGYGAIAGVATIVLFVAGGLWTQSLVGYRITASAGPDAASNPLAKTVARVPGGLMGNYKTYAWMALAPILGLAGAAAASACLMLRLRALALIASGLAAAGVVATAGVSLFPFLLPSSADPNASLTVWDASSSRTTLMIMTLVSAVLVPIVLAYTAWVYSVLRGRVTEADVAGDRHAY